MGHKCMDLCYMEKDFDAWNGAKKRLDSMHKPPLFTEREVWWCAVGINIGREENGKHELFERPVIVFRKINADTFIGIPLTSKPKQGDLLFQISFAGEMRTAKANQIKTFSAQRLIRRMGKVSNGEIEKLSKSIENGLLKKDGTPPKDGVPRAPNGDSAVMISQRARMSMGMQGFSDILAIARENAVKNPSITNAETMVAATRYLNALLDEVREVQGELHEKNEVYLTDELSDILWDWLALLAICEDRKLIESAEDVLAHAGKKYSERAPALLVESDDLWKEVKERQKQELTRRHQEKYGM